MDNLLLRDEKIKIVFLLPSLCRGGAETQLVNLANGLDARKFEKHLFTFEQQLDQLERIGRTTVNFHHVPRRYKYDIQPALELAKLIDAHDIDIVHCTLQIALFMGWLATRISKRKPHIVLALHTTVNRSTYDEMFDQLFYRWFLRSCNDIIFVCKAQQHHWHRKFPFLKGKTRVIYNGVDTDWFNPNIYFDAGRSLREQLDIPEQAKVICNIAGFRPEKGHAILLDAFQHIVARDQNTYLLLLGDGDLRSDMETRVKGGGLGRYVRFLGCLSDVRHALAASDCSVIASTAETFSIAMLESMAMQVPLVATNVGGTPEAILPGTTGLLVESGDCVQLANRLIDMLADGDSRRAMGTAARELVINKFERQKMLTKTCSFLSNIAQNINNHQWLVVE